MSFITFNCPYCNGGIVVDRKDVNCGIFRHALFKDGGPVNPHALKEELERIREKINGCGQPFKITLMEDNFKIEKCGYE